MRQIIVALGGVLALMVFVFGCIGCALVAGGTKDPMTFTSEPSGATVYVDGKAMGQTPLTVELETKEHEIVMMKEGYVPVDLHVDTVFDPWFLGNFVSWGLVGGFVDWASATMWDFTDSVTHGMLTPKDG